MQNDQLLEIATQLVNIKVPFVDETFKKDLAVEVRGKIEEMINLELFSSMTNDQADGFKALLEQGDATDQSIVDYVKGCDIDINVITSAALTKFRVAYLGA